MIASLLIRVDRKDLMPPKPDGEALRTVGVFRLLRSTKNPRVTPLAIRPRLSRDRYNRSAVADIENARMGHYEHCLHAMLRLLNAVEEKSWSLWIQEDIRLWQTASDTSHHLSAYGGMGSFNDVWLERAKQHKLTRAQEWWINPLFDWLKALCYHFALHPKKRVTALSLAKSIGLHDSALSAFVGGDRAPASMRGRVNRATKIQGWRCGHCGHADFSTQDIEYCIADTLIPPCVFQGCIDQTLDKLVDSVLELTLPGADELRKKLLKAAAASGIAKSDRNSWMNPCPKCGSQDTGVFRWYLTPKAPFQFTPAEW